LGLIESCEEISKLLENCLFCGHTLSRVGVDIKVLVYEIFSKKLNLIFEELISDGTVNQNIKKGKIYTKIKKLQLEKERSDNRIGGLQRAEY
jgi:hypothetical protein